jgi:hypothetical protein
MQPLDLQRLIQIIVEELAASESAPAPARCACHSLLYECCPDRLRGVLDAGATRLGLHATGGAPGGVASMIDHTLLKPDATRNDMGGDLCGAPAGQRREGLFGRRVSTWRDDARYKALRDQARDFRRRARDRHGHQHRRPQVR